MPKKKPPPQPDRLIATIETVDHTYYASEERKLDCFDDEAILDVTGRIEEISKPHKLHLGRQIPIATLHFHPQRSSPPRPMLRLNRSR